VWHQGRSTRPLNPAIPKCIPARIESTRYQLPAGLASSSTSDRPGQAARQAERQRDRERCFKPVAIERHKALGSTPWDAPTHEKVEHELWQFAHEILRLGLSVVLDFGLWARLERDEMRSVARRLGVGVELHYLDVPADELWRRIDARNSQPPWDGYPIRRTDLDGWLRLFHAPDAAELALFDPPPDSS
jgi:predicted kinase